MSNYESPIREPLITGDKSYSQITTDIVGTTEKSPPMSWFIAFGIAGACATFGVVGILYLLWQGVGVWGLNRTVNWAWGYYQLCMVGGNRPRGNLDLCGTFTIPPKMAYRN